MMPNGEYAEQPPPPEVLRAARRQSFAESVSYSRSSSFDSGEFEKEEIEQQEVQASSLGLEFGQLDTPRASRHRQVATVS